MFTRPVPTWVYHITRVEHVQSMIEHGIWSDSLAARRRLSTISIAHSHLKERRAKRQVPIPPGGTLADYVPFYFAPRSPMLYAIHRGNVRTHPADCTRIVYLVTSVQALRDQGYTVLGTDRHAATPLARFTADDQELTTFVDWHLMQQQYWFDVAEYPDRCERRQAELLVHSRVLWDSIRGVATQNETVRGEIERITRAADLTTAVAVKAGWYF